MEDKFIAKKDCEVLTRVQLEINGEIYTVESPYSDEDTLEMLMLCIEGYCFSNGFSSKDITSVMKNVLEDKAETFGDFKCLRNYSVKMTIEQYSKRNIVEKISAVNLIRTIMDCFVAVNVETTWLKETILNWMREYIEEHEYLESKEDKEENFSEDSENTEGIEK